MFNVFQLGRSLNDVAHKLSHRFDSMVTEKYTGFVQYVSLGHHVRFYVLCADDVPYY